jgi:coenzyme F420-reducing hydrogenase beta subunit
MNSDCFWYPSIDKDQCVNCGLCYSKCPAIAVHPDSGKIDAYDVRCIGAKTRNEDLRRESTSGGFYSELALRWLSDGGYICGAVYDKNNMVRHEIGQTVEFIRRARQSKYVQSDISGTYQGIKRLLNDGQKVVFSGAPCQVEALRAYLGKQLFESDRLLSIDFICLGTASPVVYSKYLKHLEYRYGSTVRQVHFKDKRAGWRSIGTSIQFKNGKEYFRTGSRDTYMVSYVSDALCMRQSCHSCPYRKVPHVSDITLGDFWGIEKINPAMDDNKGLSAVICNTQKGITTFQGLSDSLDYFETTARDIAKGNFTVLQPKAPNPKRDEFLKAMYTEPYMQVVKKYCSYSGFRKFITDAKFLKASMKKLFKSLLEGKR